MIIYRRLLFIFVIPCKQSVNSRVVIYLFIVIHCLHRLQPHLLLRPEIFIPVVHGTKNRRRKLAPENAVDLWRRFLERVSWV